MPDARFQPTTGFRDFAPAECAVRNYLFGVFRRVARKYNFAEYEAPIIESTELYLKKTGGELPTQLFRFEDQGGRDITLRPELTASLARIAAAYNREESKPMKWFEIGPCFRYEKPQKGRLREFYQFNADILGEASSNADAELLALAIDTMREFGFEKGDFVLRVSDREAWAGFAKSQQILEAKLPDFLGIIDKLEREKPEQIEAKLTALGTTRAAVDAFVASPPAGASTRFEEIRQDLAARGLEGFVELDLSIVRGLAYYTGLVFEIFDAKKSLRAIAGGGRYDDLVEGLSNGAVKLAASGFAMGDVVIRLLIEQTPAAKARLDTAIAAQAADIAFVLAEESPRGMALKWASQLRDAGLCVDFPLGKSKPGNQLQRAQKIGISHALIFENEQAVPIVRNLETRANLPIPEESLADSAKLAAFLKTLTRASLEKS